MARIPVDRQMLLVNLSMLMVTIFWGLNFVAMKHLIEQVGAIHVLLIRVYIAGAVFGGLLLLWNRRIPRLSRTAWRTLILVGLFGVVSNQLFVSIGASYLSAAVASMLVTSAPIFMAILSRVFVGERLTRRKITGIAIAFAGFIIVILYGGGDAEFSVHNAIGVLIILLAPLSWTTSTLISKPLMIEHDPKIITGLSTVAGSAMLLPVLFTQPGLTSEVMAFDRVSWAAALTTSVLAVVIAYTLWYQGLRKLEPTQIAIYVYLVPFFGVVFAWLLRGETITPYILLGGATILSGVIVTNSDRRPPVVPDDVEAAPETRSHETGRLRPALHGEESHNGK